MVNSDLRPLHANWPTSSDLGVIGGKNFQSDLQQTAACGSFWLLPANACHPLVESSNQPALAWHP